MISGRMGEGGFEDLYKERARRSLGWDASKFVQSPSWHQGMAPPDCCTGREGCGESVGSILYLPRMSHLTRLGRRQHRFRLKSTARARVHLRLYLSLCTRDVRPSRTPFLFQSQTAR